MIDVATGWSELRAVLGRSYLVMEDAFRYILTRLPFPMLELHSDNGSEFFNHHLLRFRKDNVQRIELSRSRPFHKKDNRFVEQKNSSLVRAYLGDDRLDTVAQTIAVNQLYDKIWVCYPLPAGNALGREDHDPCGGPGDTHKALLRPGAHPLRPLCQTTAITQKRRKQLEALRDRTNPRQLRQEIYDLLDYIFSLPHAMPEQTENVYETLITYFDLETLLLRLTLRNPDLAPAS